MVETMEILVLLGTMVFQGVVSSSCPTNQASSLTFSINSRRNMTGHWVTQVNLENLGNGEDGSTGAWNVQVSQGSEDCEGSIHLEAVITAPPKKVGPDYSLFPKVGYYKFHSEPMKWEEARQICVREGAHLMIVNSEAEAGVAVKLFALHKTIAGSSHNDYVFVGFNDIYDEGKYVTIFGDALASTGFSRWSSAGQPDDAGGNEDCGSVHRNGGLNDAPCDLKLAFICEQELW